MGIKYQIMDPTAPIADVKFHHTAFWWCLDVAELPHRFIILGVDHNVGTSYSSGQLCNVDVIWTAIDNYSRTIDWVKCPFCRSLAGEGQKCCSVCYKHGNKDECQTSSVHCLRLWWILWNIFGLNFCTAWEKCKVSICIVRQLAYTFIIMETAIISSLLPFISLSIKGSFVKNNDLNCLFALLVITFVQLEKSAK